MRQEPFAMWFAVITALAFVAFSPTPRVHAGSDSQSHRGAEYYISADGKDTNPGTRRAPFATFGKADSLAKPGTTIYVLPGTYEGFTADKTIRVAASGSENARIQWISEQKWAAKIVGHKNPANNLGWGVAIAGDYVDFEGFDVTSDANMGIWVLGTHVRVLRNHVHDIPGQPGCTSYGASGIEQGNYAGGYMEVDGNVVHHVGAGGPGSCNKYHGIYLSAPHDSAVNNIAFKNASKGITTWHAANQNVISNNTAFDNDVGILVGAGDSPCGRSCLADHVVVTNNILYRNKSYGFWEYSGAGPNNTYMNNLVFANGKKDVLFEKACAWSWRPCNEFKDAITKDPMIENPADDVSRGDFRLKPGSPARTGGTALGAPATDIEGKMRSRNSPGLGAYAGQ